MLHVYHLGIKPVLQQIWLLCCRLRKVAAEIRVVLLLQQNNVYMLRVFRTSPRQCSNLLNSRVWRDFHVILSNQK